MPQATSSDSTDSLLDEADFLAELESLDVNVAAKRQSPDVIPDLDGPVRTLPPGKFADDPQTGGFFATAEDAGASGLGLSGVATVGYFVLMTAVGAAGALLVFHNRVALLLAR